MSSASGANSTWKAISTFEWRQNQEKKPAAVSKGASAILGEAADVVAGKFASGPGGPNSPYLNRLSEIQVQDESYIHQQLVKPDDVRPKRPAHRVFVGRGSRSARGLKISVSRKVRFNEADGSPTHKSPQGGLVAGAKAGPSAATGPVRVARTSSGSSSSGPPAHAGGVKTGRRAGSARFGDDPGIASSTSQHQGKDCQQLPTAGAGEQVPASSSSALASTSSPGDGVDLVVAPGDAASSNRQQLNVQGNPAAMQNSTQLPHVPQHQHQQQEQQQQQWQSTPEISSGGNSHSHRPFVGGNGSTAARTSSMADHSSGDGVLLAKFLETQPYGLDSPASSGRHVAGTGSRRSSIDLSQLADSQGWLAGTGARVGRRTTDLVDKQLQLLRDSTAASSSSSGSNNNSSSNQSSSIAPALGTPAAPSSAVPHLTSSLGYRPIGIPQELFDRWTSLGGSKHPPPHSPAAAPAAAATDGVAATRAAAGGSAVAPGASSSSTSGSHLSSSRGSHQGASPGSSRPGSGFEPASKTTAAAAAAAQVAAPGHQEARAVSPVRRLSATNVPEVRRTVDGAGHNMMARQRSADSATVHALASSSKPYDAVGKANWSAAVPASGSGLTPARSLPTSGRATPARKPSSPRVARGLSSVNDSAGRLASSSSWQPAPGGTEMCRSRATASSSSSHGDEKSVGLGLASSAGAGHSAQVRRGSRATGSSTSSHGDDHEHWELQAGRHSSLQSTSSSGPLGRPATHNAVMLPTAAAATVKIGSSASSMGHAGRVHLPDIAVRAAAKPHYVQAVIRPHIL